MKEIVFKDKVITLTEDTLEVRRMEGKWFQSLFEVALIKMVISLYIIVIIFAYIFYFNEGAIQSNLFTLFIGVGLFPFTRVFLEYYKDRIIPLNQIKGTDINRINQLVITYTGEKSDTIQMINLPKNSSEREKVLNQLLQEELIEDDIPELPFDSEKRMHRNNLYLGIVGTLLCLVFYFTLINKGLDNFILAFNSIILLFSIVSIIFSANKLLKMRQLHAL